MWQTLYDSPLWLPILPTLAACGMLLASARGAFETRSARHVAVTFALLAAVDAWLNGPWTPLPATSPWASASAVAGVILGDLRYFLIVRLGRMAFRAALLRALGLALLVPVLSQLVVRVPFPDLTPRVLFLIYELALLVLLVVEHLRRTPRDHTSRALLRFELAQYGLWVLADVLLLAHVEAGYGLRVLPNLLYYVAFAPFAAHVLARRSTP